MGKKLEQTTEYMNARYNCAQAVFCAYFNEMGMSLEEAKEKSRPWGHGGAVKCGAVKSAVTVLDRIGKVEKIPEMERKFAEIYTSVNCREIRSRAGAAKPCRQCISDAARILEDVL